LPIWKDDVMVDVIRVVIADDNDVVRSSLRLFLSICDDMQLVGEAANGKEAVSLCERLQPDLVLMDLMMPEMDGAAATQIIRQQFPHIRVLILTSAVDLDLITAAIAAGADGYLQKNVSIDVMAEAIRFAVV
jgi:two-component system, NarL family, response regulator LiaR